MSEKEIEIQDNDDIFENAPEEILDKEEEPSLPEPPNVEPKNTKKSISEPIETKIEKVSKLKTKITPKQLEARKKNAKKAGLAKLAKLKEKKAEQQLPQYEIPEQNDEDDEEDEEDDENTKWVLQQLKPQKTIKQPKQSSQIDYQNEINMLKDMMTKLLTTKAKQKSKPKTEKKTIVQVMPPQVVFQSPQNTQEDPKRLSFEKGGFTYRQ